MGQNSAIEWLKLFGDGGHTWNPIRSRLKEPLIKIVNGQRKIVPAGTVGWFCVKVNELCAGCYAEDQNVVCGTNPGRMGNGVRYALDQLPKVEIFLDEKTLEQPLHWKKPAGIFPCSMTDLFGGFVPEGFISRVYDVMEQAHWHTFLVLTKRPDTRRNFLARRYKGRKPAPNIWEGVSVGNQETADEFIPELLQTEAALRWVSAEPMLGPIDLDFIGITGKSESAIGCRPCNWRQETATAQSGGHTCHEDKPRIDWVVVGGESGPKARPMHPDWARSLRDQCQRAGVPFFFKQWGEWAPFSLSNRRSKHDLMMGASGFTLAFPFNGSQLPQEELIRMSRLGKYTAGRLLDGREWNEFPEVVRA